MQDDGIMGEVFGGNGQIEFDGDVCGSDFSGVPRDEYGLDVVDAQFDDESSRIGARVVG